MFFGSKSGFSLQNRLFLKKISSFIKQKYFHRSFSLEAPQMFRYRFEVEYESENGEELYVTGSIPQLGNWRLNQARKLDWNRKSIYSISDLILPKEFEYSYFCKRKHSVHWEEIAKRKCSFQQEKSYSSSPTEGSVVEFCLEDKWNSNESKVTVNRKRWWKESVVYQIYPRSFKDSNNDGIGDICGIISKLDYLKDLGVNAVWISPMYKSPMADNGYDISDYESVAEEFGTMEDWQALSREMKKRNMKLIMDLVVNHTSDEHPWFIESKKSKENKYRDYYIWRPPNHITGKEPNNWRSFFGGSAWQLDENTGDYYLHLFATKQPDLNWENPQVREEIFKMMDFWIEKGIEGFRMDVINVISKVTDFPDAVEKVEGLLYQWGGEFFVDGPRLMEFLREMKSKVLSKGDFITVGETPFFGIDQANRMTNERDGVVNMLFHFELMGIDIKPGEEKWESKPWKLHEIKEVMSGWQRELQGKGWNSLYLENHDQPRSSSRFGSGEGKYHSISVKMLATWLFMMQGTPYIYQGQEIGMTNVPFKSIEEYRDIETLNFYNEAVLQNKRDPSEVLDKIRIKSRDNSRTPMQWSSDDNAGFTNGKPWIDVNPNYKSINVEDALKDLNSTYYFYKNLIEIRKRIPVMIYGSFREIMKDNEEIYAYVRTFFDQNLLVICNFRDGTPTFQLPPNIDFEEPKLVISNYPSEQARNFSSFQLKPYEALVFTFKKPSDENSLGEQESNSH